MAARLNPRNDERTRSTIQTTQLCKRLNYFALGLPEPTTGRPPEMSDAQIRAALGLLRKTLPDLAVTQIEGAGGGPLVVDFRWADAPTQPLTIDAVAISNTSVADEITETVADDTTTVTFIGEC